MMRTQEENENKKKKLLIPIEQGKVGYWQSQGEYQ